MIKDVKFPEVKDVIVTVVLEEHPEYKTMDWNVYIINNKGVPIEMVLIVSKGYDNAKKTSIMRHKIENLPAKSYAKIELLQDDVLALNNEFKVTFFEDNKMYDKAFLFKKNSIHKSNLRALPVMQQQGVLPT
ncbi:MAG: hypothetical protein HKN99_08925 [Winogradskyella sp.]|nr:hypothetical protein [Winogradskyella sp.]